MASRIHLAILGQDKNRVGERAEVAQQVARRANRIHPTILKDRKDRKDRKARQAAALDLAKKVARLQAAHQAAMAAQAPEAMESLLSLMVTARAKAMAKIPTAETTLMHRTKAKALP